MTFATTRWSIVLKTRGPDSDAALDLLCRTYWYPLYAYARRKGNDPDRAEDLVQGFFAQFLERGSFSAADPERGRFRAFLLTSFRNFAANEHQREQALKRGGGLVRISLDGGEDRYRIEPCHSATPERAFERDWALALLGGVLKELRASYARKGREPLFDALKVSLTGGGAAHAETAAAFDMSEGAVKVAAHRLRRRYGEALRAAIADTLPDAGDINAEIAGLFNALAAR